MVVRLVLPKKRTTFPSRHLTPFFKFLEEVNALFEEENAPKV